MRSRYSSSLQKIFGIQEKIQDIHPFLQKLYPVAIVEDGYFLIYDVEPGCRQYRFVKETAVPMPMPQGVRAAFPLESYENRMACVVTSDVFDDLAGYVTIFHEFIHCRQAEICEQKVKQKLGVARKALAANDFMWELNHPFPYAAPDFVQGYETFLAKQEMAEVESIRQQLKTLLNEEDYEYMVWQEWKEGFARFVENQINGRQNLPENHGGKEKPFNRVVFYAGGAHYIQLLSQQEAQLAIDIEKLFDRMFQVR